MPMRDAFAVLFFVAVGMLFDPAALLVAPLAAFAALACVLVGKPLVALLFLLGSGQPPRTALAVSAGLAQVSEFGFVLAGLALQVGESRGAVLPSFAAVFAVAAMCRLGSTALLAGCSEPSPPAAAAARQTDAGRVRRLVEAARDMAARPSGRLVTFLWCFLFGAHVSGPYFTPYMLRELGFSYHAYMLVFAASFLTKAIVFPALGRLASRIGSVSLLWGAVLSITPLALLWLPAEGVPYLIGVQVLAAAGRPGNWP